MGTKFEDLINSNNLSRDELIILLNATGEERTELFRKAAEIKKQYVGNKVYFRGLIEYSNYCIKNCYYCGIRKSNKSICRYKMTEDEVLSAAHFAHTEKYASMVIQAGELCSPFFTAEITNLLKIIGKETNHEMGITLSLGEQSEGTILKWKNAGAHRYLIRIESSNPELYKKIHPDNKTHDYEKRLEFIKLLRKTGYQVGTGVMIGLPFQTIEDLANDLIFFRDYDIDMVGMGPYIEHQDTPLFQYKDLLLSKHDRFDLSLKMIAILRIMMKDINIAATTAMQALEKTGREKAIMVGANIIMPNLTPVKYRENYLLYEDKPCIDEEAEDCKNCLEARIRIAGDEIGYGEWGDSLHYVKRRFK
jgi:biotin synthase